MRLRGTDKWNGIVLWLWGMVIIEVNGYKGTVTLARWQKWLDSLQPINNGYWLDYKNSPAWYLKGLGGSLIDLIKKIEKTHPLHTSVKQIDEGLTKNKPKDLATLNIEIIDGMRELRKAEEGMDEANVLDSEANEFVTLGDSIRMFTDKSVASDFEGSYKIPMPHAYVPSEEALDRALNQALDSEGPIFGVTQRSHNLISEVLDDSILEKKLFDKIEGRQGSVYREFEVLIDQIINSPVELKTDIWGERTGHLFKTEIFVAVINLYKAVHDQVPLTDPKAISFWLYKANSLTTDIEGRVLVNYNTKAKDDIRNAFEAMVKTFDSMDQRLGRWLRNLERVLQVKENINFVRQQVIDLQIFIWAYRVNFAQLFKVIDDGIKLPVGIEG
ncbi:hypothetical protein TWF730_008778 [Orbilia blumenaviensis]|uniref:Uncharacterized protein n=1 Tax=Orbilia blumenaviensis TaxID=1796055 RepID=A0AAV9V5P9_9PEZI